MQKDLFDGKSTLIYVMAWCCQAVGHFLNQYWPRSQPCGNYRPQWVRRWYTVIQILMNITLSIRMFGIKASNIIELLQRWFRLNWFMELELHRVSLDRKQWAGCHVQETAWHGWDSVSFLSEVEIAPAGNYFHLENLGECVQWDLILSLRPANERRRYFVTSSLIGCAQA